MFIYFICFSLYIIYFFNYEIVRTSSHKLVIPSLLIDIMRYVPDNFKYSLNKSPEPLEGGRVKYS